MQSSSRWNGALPAPSATVEWTVPKLLESLKLQHHEALFGTMTFGELKKRDDIKSIPGLPMGPAIKIIRKLADIQKTSQDVQMFRLAGYQLGKAPSLNTSGSGTDLASNNEGAKSEEASFKPGVALTMRRKPKQEPVSVLDTSMLYADGETRKIQEQLDGRRQRRPTITLAPKEALDLQNMLEEQHEESTMGGRVVSSAPNFFDLFGLNSTIPPNKPLPQPPSAEEEGGTEEDTTDSKSEDAKDVLNMQLNPDTGKLVVVAGSFPDIVDCTIFYVNISEEFVNEMIFTHLYFCSSTKKLLNAFKAHFVNTQNLITQASSAEEKKSAGKVMQQVQERLVSLIEKWIEFHFYTFDDNLELLQFFQNEFMDVVVLDKEKLKRLYLIIDATVIIRKFNPSQRSKNASVAKEEVVTQLLRDDKSGLIMDRRKNLRLFKQAFVAVEAINLIMRKLKIDDRSVAISLLDVLRERGAIANALKDNNSEFEDGDALWQFKAGHRNVLVREDIDSGVSLIDMNAHCIAEQLTLMEFETFQHITPTELSFQAWSKHDGIKAPNVMKLINGFNQTTYWVATEICSVAKLEQRVAMIVKMIEIAERCEQLHNFQTLMEILVGLSMGMVSRLTQSWDAVPKEKMSMFQKLQSLIDNRKNYANYRLVYRDAALPCFPYLGLQLKDLTFIEDGNESFLDANKKTINWQKMSMIAGVFRDVAKFQQCSYDFGVMPGVMAYLNTRSIIVDDTELYNLSFSCQPRKKKESAATE